MPDAIHAQQSAIEWEVEKLAEMTSPGYVFEWLNEMSGQYLMLAAHIGELEIEALEGDDADVIAMLASAKVEGHG